MKAIRVSSFGDESVLKVGEVPYPTAGAGQVVVKVHAAGVNPVDTYVRAGKYPLLPQVPFTPGSDGAGVVESIGPGVASVATGDRVYFGRALTGAYAEKAVVEERFVGRLPEGVSFDQGAAIYVPYFTAHYALWIRAKVLPGETVLVHGGTGSVGQAAIQWLRGTGTRVLATGGTEEGRKLLASQGAHAVFDHHEKGYLDKIKAAAPNGIDVILEMAAHTNLGHDLPLLSKHGRVIVIGNRSEVQINARDIMGKDADIRGMTLFNIAPDQLARIHRATQAGLAEGRLSPVVSHKLPLTDAPEAHRLVMAPGARGKIILVP